MIRMSLVVPLLLGATLAIQAQTQPLTELGQGTYRGSEGGLYPNGSNTRPAAHDAAGLALAAQVQPLDRNGHPDLNGHIVLLSIGLSNTTMEFSTFITNANANPQKSPSLLLVDGAVGGMPARVIQNPNDGGQGTRYWSIVDQRLTTRGATRAQVEAVWLKETDPHPTGGFPGFANTLETELGNIVRVLRARFANLKMVYLSSRIYAGYATTPLNPEPYAYESGFSVKWLIESQINGTGNLGYDPQTGTAPWLS